MTAAKSAGPLTIAFDKFDDEEISNNLISTVEELSKGTEFFIFPNRIPAIYFGGNSLTNEATFTFTNM